MPSANDEIWSLDEVVGTVGHLYSSRGLSPPFRLREAAQHWIGLPLDDIVRVVEEHFDKWGHQYRSGAGDRCFPMIDADIHKLLYERLGTPYGGAPDPDDQPARPRRRGVRKLYANGATDVIDDREEGDYDVSRPGAPQPFVSRESRGPKVSVDANLEDDDTREDA